MEDRRKIPAVAEISPELLARATDQLESEIRIIESWLQDLEETREDNPESVAARQAYGDMLQSRRDLLNTLKEQGS